MKGGTVTPERKEKKPRGYFPYPGPAPAPHVGAGPPGSGHLCQAFLRLSTQISSVRLKLRNSISRSRDKTGYGCEDWTCCGRISTKREVSLEMKPKEETGKRRLEVLEP